MSFCKHVWDIFSRIWTADGTRGMPCTKCDAVMEIGTMAIKHGGEHKKLDKENGA